MFTKTFTFFIYTGKQRNKYCRACLWVCVKNLSKCQSNLTRNDSIEGLFISTLFTTDIFHGNPIWVRQKDLLTFCEVFAELNTWKKLIRLPDSWSILYCRSIKITDTISLKYTYFRWWNMFKRQFCTEIISADVSNGWFTKQYSYLSW